MATTPETMPTSDPYFSEWRHNVNGELAETARLHKEASVTFERIRGQLDEHDRRIANLEHTPTTLRDTLGTYGGCAGQVVFALLSSFGTLMAIASLIITLTHK